MLIAIVRMDENQFTQFELETGERNDFSVHPGDSYLEMSYGQVVFSDLDTRDHSSKEHMRATVHLPAPYPNAPADVVELRKLSSEELAVVVYEAYRTMREALDVALDTTHG